jgi:anion-transporting  ArsA/GET3 family ATPase
VGGQVVSDAVAFFQAFEGMEQGFRDRAQKVMALLADPGTAFVLVASPRRDAVEEALFFADKLLESGIGVDALVVNRLHPRFGGSADEAGAAERDLPAGSAVAPGLAALYANLADFRDIAAREEHHFAELAARVAPAPVARVPFLADDVHDVAGLQTVGAYLFGAEAESAA